MKKNVSAFKIKPSQTSTTKLKGTENNNTKIRLKFHVFSRGQKLDCEVLVKLKTEKMKFHAYQVPMFIRYSNLQFLS